MVMTGGRVEVVTGDRDTVVTGGKCCSDDWW